MNMDRLLKAKSFVLIGASDKPGFGKDPALGIAMGKGVTVYYLNPRRDVLFDRKVYHSLSELPEVPECMVFCTPGRVVKQYLEEGGKMGIRSAIVFASGFSEERSEESHAMERELVEICEKYDIVMCGPNCVGFINYIDQISGSSSMPVFPETPLKKGCGLVAHSGYIMGQTQKSIPDIVAYAVSAGNSAVCSLEDYMLYFAHDDSVNCIAAYLEGTKKPEVLEEALKVAAMKRKPVVVLKSGRSKKGVFSAASHTGNMAGSFQTYESVFRKYGVVLTSNFMEFTACAKMFTLMDGKFPVQTGIGAINFSGGENTLCADICEKYGLELPDFEQKTVDAIAAVIPSYATAANPLDPTTTLFAQEEKVRTLFSAISSDKNIGIMTIGNDLGAVSQMKDITCTNLLEKMTTEGGLAPTFFVPTVEKERNRELVGRLEKMGIPVLPTGEMAYAALKHLVDFVNYDHTEHTMEYILPAISDKERDYVSLSEHVSKNELARYGINIPPQIILKPEDNQDVIKEKLALTEYPVVLKISSPDITHKTEAGGVKLNINSAEEAMDAYHEILKNCENYKPDAEIEGVMVQKMMPKGTEIIIGIQNDAQFGPQLLVGLGGIYVEVFKDISLYPCPVSKKEAECMLQQLKAYRVLTGYRGSEPVDLDALTDLMVGVSTYAIEHIHEVKEMDLNPVVVYEEGKGAVAVDALIVKYV